MREDAGLSRRALAAAAGIDDGYLGQLERGEREPSLTVLVALASALGGVANVRLYPGTGPRLRDPVQARIVEALLRIADPRWQRHVEVPVYRPVRGVIDVVLVDRTSSAVVAIEVHSELRRLEQQLRWANEKAAALPSSAIWPSAGARPVVHRLMVVRSTRTNRRLAAEFATTLATAYPASAAAAFQALAEPATPWPGDAWVWATLDAESARIHAPVRT
jgi:transcriptional regulator with XRE-family HTH domain